MTFIIIVFVCLIVTSSQPLLLAFGFVTLLLIYKLFWRPGQPKAIFFGLLLFWLSIIVKLFYADINNFSFEELSISPHILQTAYIAMLSLVVFSAGIFLMTSNTREVRIAALPDVNDYDTKKVILVYLGSIALKSALGSLGAIGLGEVAKALITLRSGFIFVLLYIYYKKNANLSLPLVITGIEVFLSFFSYFSSFKDILISFLVAFTFFKIELKGKQLFFLVFFAAGSLYLLLIWQAVKSDYRRYLSGGERSQAVVVDRDDALNRFYSLAKESKINDPELWYESIDRLSYIEFFSEATDNVPATISFENGALWKNNINHVLVPRFLNPNKKVIYDSEMVNRYATRKVAGADVGVSFSLGFLAESYIDYGYIFMFIPVFLLGIFMGWIYRFIINTSINYMWGCAFVTPLWVYFNCNGMPGAKILGWMIMYCLVFFLVNRYIVKHIDNFLRSSGYSAPGKAVITPLEIQGYE